MYVCDEKENCVYVCDEKENCVYVFHVCVVYVAYVIYIRDYVYFITILICLFLTYCVNNIGIVAVLECRST